MTEENKKVNTKINFRSEIFKKYFANTSWLFGEKIARIIITFFVGVLLVRFLGPENFGILSYSLSFITLFSAIAILGIEKIVVKELSNNPAEHNSILGTAFLLRIIGTLTAITLIALGLLFTGDSGITLVLIIILSSTIVFRSVQVIDYYFTSKVISKYSVYSQFSALVIGSIAKLVLILLKAHLIYFGVVIAAESLIMAVILIFHYQHRSQSIYNWKFSKPVALNILKESWPLIISGLAVAAYMRIDQLMLKQMLNETEVGYYAAAVQLCEAWYFVPVVICSSLFPAILSAKKYSEKLYESRNQKLFDLLAWISISIALPVSFFSGTIIKILFGNEFLSSSPVLTIYIWAGVAAFLGVASGQYLVAEKLTKITLGRTILGLILNVVLNLLLIPKYGIVGSAYATLISYTFALFTVGFFVKTRYHFWMMIKSLLLISLTQYIIDRVKKRIN